MELDFFLWFGQKKETRVSGKCLVDVRTRREEVVGSYTLCLDKDRKITHTPTHRISQKYRPDLNYPQVKKGTPQLCCY